MRRGGAPCAASNSRRDVVAEYPNRTAASAPARPSPGFSNVGRGHVPCRGTRRPPGSFDQTQRGALLGPRERNLDNLIRRGRRR